MTFSLWIIQNRDVIIALGKKKTKNDYANDSCRETENFVLIAVISPKYGT